MTATRIICPLPAAFNYGKTPLHQQQLVLGHANGWTYRIIIHLVNLHGHRNLNVPGHGSWGSSDCVDHVNPDKGELNHLTNKPSIECLVVVAQCCELVLAIC